MKRKILMSVVVGFVAYHIVQFLRAPQADTRAVHRAKGQNSNGYATRLSHQQYERDQVFGWLGPDEDDQIVGAKALANAIKEATRRSRGGFTQNPVDEFRAVSSL